MTSFAPPPLALLVSPLVWLRTPPLALRNVQHGGARSLLAIAGVGFSITLVLLQLGFLEAVRITARMVYDQIEFDVVLVSPQYEQFFGPGAFPLSRLKEAQSEPGVTAAYPLYARMTFWRCPPYPLDSAARAPKAIENLTPLQRWWLGSRRPRALQLRELLVLGVDLEHNPFHDPIRAQVEAARAKLQDRDRLLLNEWSTTDFGWESWAKFSDWELNGRSVKVVGGFTLQRSFGADAAVVCSDTNFASALRLPGVGLVNFGLLKVDHPERVSEVVRGLNLRLPPDVRALSRAELIAEEEDYWVRQTATGKIFAYGVLVTIFVAAVVIYQVLANDIRDHISEYATLKAIGHTNFFLSRVVVMQALIYSLAAYFPAVAAGAGLYKATEELANIPMRLTAVNLGSVLLLTLTASLVSALLTLDKVRSADPASLF
jgi:putative ABC transport system permease protein